MSHRTVLASSLQQPTWPTLEVRIPEMGSRTFEIQANSNVLGRADDADIPVPSPMVSGRHLRIYRDAQGWAFEDLGSTNGTHHNGHIKAGSLLHDGDVLRVGADESRTTTMVFRLAGADAAHDALGVVHHGTLPLAGARQLRIGRSPDADVTLDNPLVSFYHARIDAVASGHVLTDLGSTNGTWVNGVRLAKPHALQPGDTVKIGSWELSYDGAGMQQFHADAGMRVDAVDLTRVVGGGRRILDDVDLTVLPREFVALVGASGAGKSTLLKAMCGAAPADGNVLVNGDSLRSQFDLYRAQIGYVPQDDIIHMELTVGSALKHAAALRLPADTTRDEIQRRVDSVLDTVELRGKEDQRIGSLSGGQRKRISIAVELLSEPRLLFLDEPTSGLDPGLDKKMMRTLRRLADEGRTVMLVTHATANIAECDFVCFMAQGHLVYYGPPDEAFEFFGVTTGDFADIYSVVDAPEQPEALQKAQEWRARYRESRWHAQYVEARARQRPAGSAVAGTMRSDRPRPARAWHQFRVLTSRYLQLVRQDRLLLFMLLAVMPIIGLLLAAIAEPHWLDGLQPDLSACVGDSGLSAAACLDGQVMPARLSESDASWPRRASYRVVYDTQTLSFMLALAAVMLGLFASAFEIVKERSVFMRERMINLRLVPYVASKFFVLGVFSLIQAALLLATLGVGVSFPDADTVFGAVPDMYVTIMLAIVAAVAMGLLISALVPNRNTVIYIVLLVLFFQIVLAGAVFALSDWMQPVSRLNLTRWAMEGIGSSVDIESVGQLSRTLFKAGQATPAVNIPTEFNTALNYKADAGHMVGVWTVLVLSSTLCFAGTVAALKRLDRLR